MILVVHFFREKYNTYRVFDNLFRVNSNYLIFDAQHIKIFLLFNLNNQSYSIKSSMPCDIIHYIGLFITKDFRKESLNNFQKSL